MESEAHQKASLSLQAFYTGPTIASRAPFKAADAEEPEQWIPTSPDARKRRGIGGDQLGGSRHGSSADEAQPLLPQRVPLDASIHLEGADRPRHMDRSASDRDADHVEAHFAQAMPHQMTILGLVFLDLFAVGLAMPLVVPLIKDLGTQIPSSTLLLAPCQGPCHPVLVLKLTSSKLLSC